MKKPFVYFCCIILMTNCTSKTTNSTPVSPVVIVPVVEKTFTTDSCGVNQDEAVLSKDGWKKVWSEDFSSNLDNWKPWNGGAYNNEYQLYQAGNLSLKDGVLKITPYRELVSGAEVPLSTRTKTFDFTSGRLETKTNFTPNGGTNYSMIRFSARVKTPKGLGLWPAFWAYGDNWPTNGEIDVVESDGNTPKKYSTNYFYGNEINKPLTKSTVVTINSDTDLTSCWQVYEVIWEKDQLTFFLNGKQVSQNKGNFVPDMYNKKQNIVLNLAIGGDYVGNPAKNTIQLAPMYADWVRVYTK